MNTKQKMLLIPALVLLLVGVITASAAAAPYITGVTTVVDGKNYGPADVSVKLKIVGTGFSSPHVWFDGQNLTSYITSVNSGTIVLSGYPVSQTPRTVFVQVFEATGPSNLLTFTYVGQPVVSAVNPNNGPISGGTIVKITGSSFLGTSEVKFGAKTATSFTVDSNNQITATAPAGVNLGFVSVIVKNTFTKNNGNTISKTSDPLKNAFEYYQGPVIYSVVPNQGPAAGSDEVIINGAGFTPGYLEDDGVMFGNTHADINWYDDHRISVKAPPITLAQSANPKTVDIQVTVNGVKTAISDADKYTYIVKPYIRSLSTNVGKLDGGNTITVTGNGFTGVSAVNFIGFPSCTSSLPADGITFVSDKKIKVVVPPGYDFSADKYNVKLEVVSDGGTSNVNDGSNPSYQYEQIPTITSIAPSQGTAGTKVTLIIDGSVLGVPELPVQNVMFGSVAATDITIIDQHKIIAVAPPQAATGKYAVKLVTNAGSSTSNPKFKYV